VTKQILEEIAVANLSSFPSGNQLFYGSRGPCNNTEQGRDLIADSMGFVCEPDLVDESSGCCPTHGPGVRPRFSCDAMWKNSTCFEVFELCVACCLNPVFQSILSVEKKKQSKKVLYRTADANGNFEFCRTRCRTHPSSVTHENRYRRRWHYCFASTDEFEELKGIIQQRSVD